MLRERVEHLKAELGQLEGALDQANASIAQLNVAIAEVAQAIEDRKASAFGNALKSIALMGVCILPLGHLPRLFKLLWALLQELVVQLPRE